MESKFAIKSKEKAQNLTISSLFDGTSVHNDTPANPHEIKAFGSRRTHFTLS